jgi:hypothetical protein
MTVRLASMAVSQCDLDQSLIPPYAAGPAKSPAKLDADQIGGKIPLLRLFDPDHGCS